MLHNISPNRTRSKAGSLTLEEKQYAKTLIKRGYVVQDVVFIINQGRTKTVNQSVVQLAANDKKITTCDDSALDKYLATQATYDPKTLLNPYKDERLIRAREAMIAAVQNFNSPAMTFKAELFCVLANIAWTYLLHEKMERTKLGSAKLDNGNSVTVGGTLGKEICPMKDPGVVENLRKLIEIRDAVEHTFFVGSDHCFGALFQACCINFERYMTQWFGQHLTLSKDLSLALQFARLQKGQLTEVERCNLPEKIRAIHESIENCEHANNNAFQLTVYYSTETSTKTNADLHKLVDYEDSPDPKLVTIKRVDYTRKSQAQIVKKVIASGYKKFTDREHQKFWMQKWKTATERNTKAKKFGEVLLGNQWMWFEEPWLREVLNYCKDSGDKFK